MFLRLDGLVITSAGPYMKRDGMGVRGRKGCQIDLLIQAWRTICVVEIKRRCEIGREIIEDVDKIRLSFFLLPSRTCLYFLIFGKAIIEGRSSLHDFFGRYIMEFEKTPEIRSINYMKKVKLRVERGKSG